MEKKVKCPYCQEDVEGAIVCRGCGAEAYYVELDGYGCTGITITCIPIAVGIGLGMSTAVWWGYPMAFFAFMFLISAVGKRQSKRWRR